jgi:hypothetical protein
MTAIYSLLLHVHWRPQSRLDRRCLVGASNGRCYTSSRLSNCQRPQRPPSNSNSSQQLNPSKISDCNSRSLSHYYRQAVSLHVETHLGLMTRYQLLLHIYSSVHMRRGGVYHQAVEAYRVVRCYGSHIV